MPSLYFQQPQIVHNILGGTRFATSMHHRCHGELNISKFEGCNGKQSKIKKTKALRKRNIAEIDSSNLGYHGKGDNMKNSLSTKKRKIKQDKRSRHVSVTREQVLGDILDDSLSCDAFISKYFNFVSSGSDSSTLAPLKVIQLDEVEHDVVISGDSSVSTMEIVECRDELIDNNFQKVETCIFQSLSA